MVKYNIVAGLPHTKIQKSTERRKEQNEQRKKNHQGAGAAEA